MLLYPECIPRQKWIGVPRPSSFNCCFSAVARAKRRPELVASSRVGGFSLHHHHFSASSHIRIREERKPVTSNMDPSATRWFFVVVVVAQLATTSSATTTTIPYHLRLDGQTRRVVVPLFVCVEAHTASSSHSEAMTRTSTFRQLAN